MAAKRKQWGADSMPVMLLKMIFVKQLESIMSLWRTGFVSLNCRPGSPAILSTEEEARLAQYCIAMADMGFMAMACAIVDKTGRGHSFKGGHAGRGWYEGFMARQATLTLCGCMHELFFLTRRPLMTSAGCYLWAAEPKLSQIAYETGVSIVYCPLLLRSVDISLTSAEGEKHTILACVSASGQVIPPFMVYSMKRPIPDKMRIGQIQCFM